MLVQPIDIGLYNYGLFSRDGGHLIYDRKEECFHGDRDPIPKHIWAPQKGWNPDVVVASSPLVNPSLSIDHIAAIGYTKDIVCIHRTLESAWITAVLLPNERSQMLSLIESMQTQLREHEEYFATHIEAEKIADLMTAPASQLLEALQQCIAAKHLVYLDVLPLASKSLH